MTKYYILDPWYSDAYINDRSIKVVFDTGNSSNSFISCKKFPEVPRIPISVFPNTITRFNLSVAPKLKIPTIPTGISMKDLYKHIQNNNVQRRIPAEQYRELMKSLGFIFVQSGGGSLHIINLEIASISIRISGLPFPLTARVYCSYIDTEWDVLFSMKYIASLLDKKIMISPTSKTSQIYTELPILQRDIDKISMSVGDIDSLLEDDTSMDNMSLLIEKRTRLDQISKTKVPAREVLLSSVPIE